MPIRIEGDPRSVTLHEVLSALADWLAYEADVVDEAAGGTSGAVAEKAEKQAEAMSEAAEAVADAADAARETAAKVFDESGVAASDVAGTETPEGKVLGGNPLGKFPSEKAETLYSEVPDDEAGDSSEGVGWAGLYREKVGGYILFESPDGFVDIESYDSTEELMRRWAEVEEELNAVYGNPVDSPPEATHWYLRPLFGRRMSDG